MKQVYDKESKEYQFEKEFYMFRQEFAIAECHTDWIASLCEEASKLGKKYPGWFYADMIIAFVHEQERQYNRMVAMNSSHTEEEQK